MPRVNTQKDFWKRVQKTNSCWDWIGPVSDRGYGKTHFAGKEWRAHRLSFYFKTKQKPMCVCHTCDNPACVRPSHLFAGTHAMNAADRAAKGRSAKPKGELHPHAKLTEKIVLFFRASTLPSQDLADIYGVSRTCVEQARSRKRWAHI